MIWQTMDTAPTDGRIFLAVKRAPIGKDKTFYTLAAFNPRAGYFETHNGWLLKKSEDLIDMRWTPIENVPEIK